MSQTNQPEADQGRIVCSVHPEEPATAMCFDCEVPICGRCLVRDADGLALCPACAGQPVEIPPRPKPTKSPAEAVGAYQAQLNPQEPRLEEGYAIPWESPQAPTDVSAFLSTAFLAVTHPVRFMTSACASRGDLITPTIFGLCAAMLGQAAVTAQVFMSPDPLPMPALVAAELGHVSIKALMLALLPVLPILIAGALLTKAVLAHAILGLFGRRAGPFEATLRIFVYAEVASLLLFIPGIGVYGEKFLAVFLVMTGLRLAHGATLGASLVALFPLLFFQMLQL